MRSGVNRAAQRVAVVAVCLTLAAVACSDDEDTGDDAATTDASTVESAPTVEDSQTQTEEADSTSEATSPEATAGESADVEVPTAPMSDADAAALDAAAAEGLEAAAGQLPGMWVGVWDPDKGVHLAAYGDAVAESVPATIEDTGRIGSITKTFTATAVLQQVAAGTLSLDDTIADVLPGLADEAPEIADITVEQLLSMRSGIPEYEYAVVPQVLADPTAVIDLHEVIVDTVNSGIEPAGTAMYSTTNYLILGEMLAETTGQPVEDVLDTLATETGLTTTALPVDDEFAMPDPSSAGYVNEFAAEGLNAEGIDVEPLGDVSSYNPTWGGAGGSMYSTIEDLGVWAATGFGNELLPPELATQRLEASPLPEGIDYGLGIIDYGNGWYGHTGEILGWSSIAAHNNATGATFVAYVNESGSLLATAGPALAAFPDLVGAYALG